MTDYAAFHCSIMSNLHGEEYYSSDGKTLIAVDTDKDRLRVRVNKFYAMPEQAGSHRGTVLKIPDDEDSSNTFYGGQGCRYQARIRIEAVEPMASDDAQIDDQGRLELARLREDSAHLDWLGANPRRAVIMIDGDQKECTFYGIATAEKRTMREAIAAARAKLEPQH